MTDKEVKERLLNPEQKAAYKKLRAAWYAKKAERGRDLTQKSFGEKYGLTQSTVTQYLTGRISLNLVALNRFCKELDLDPMEIYPSLAKEAMDSADTDEAKIIEALKALSVEDKKSILSLAQSLGKGKD